MTTTDLYSGYTGDGKPSSRVLRPPGGQSSNIFGGDEPPAPQQQQRRPEQVQFAEDNYQNNAAPAAPAHSNPTSDAQNEYQRNRPTGRAEAPFAMFEESGKHSQPTQFNQCDETSQKDADFGRYSVSAYRDAVQRNAAIRERARGQATGLVNPITHEDSSAPHPYENGHRAHAPAPAHAAQSQEQPQRMVRGQRKPSDKVQYNPITGEEYPADYGQQNEEEEQTEATPPVTTEATAPATTEATLPETTTGGPPKPKTPSVKVRQPPGGKSSGPLW